MPCQESDGSAKITILQSSQDGGGVIDVVCNAPPFEYSCVPQEGGERGKVNGIFVTDIYPHLTYKKTPSITSYGDYRIEGNWVNLIAGDIDNWSKTYVNWGCDEVGTWECQISGDRFIIEPYGRVGGIGFYVWQLWVYTGNSGVGVLCRPNQKAGKPYFTHDWIGTNIPTCTPYNQIPWGWYPNSKELIITKITKLSSQGSIRYKVEFFADDEAIFSKTYNDDPEVSIEFAPQLGHDFKITDKYGRTFFKKEYIECPIVTWVCGKNCPSGTVCECEHDGHKCCFDSDGNLIAVIR